MEIELFTRLGEFVTKINILPYQNMESLVIKWGERIFIHDIKDGNFYEGLMIFPIEDK